MTDRDLHDLAAAFGEGSLFGGLSDAARLRLAEAAADVRLDGGETLFSRGDPGDTAYVVVSGGLEAAVLDQEGRSFTLAVFGPGAVVGELAVLDGETRSADVRATRRTRLMGVSRSAVLDVLTTDRDAARAMMRVLARRLRAADAALELQTWGGLPEKLARLLLAEAGGGARVALTQTEMARRLGVARENVNRRLHAWRAEGIVDVTRAGVRVLDRTRLAALIPTSADRPPD